LSDTLTSVTARPGTKEGRKANLRKGRSRGKVFVHENDRNNKTDIRMGRDTKEKKNKFESAGSLEIKSVHREKKQESRECDGKERCKTISREREPRT